MNIVVIIDYPDELKFNAMLAVFFESLHHHNPIANVTVITNDSLSKTARQVAKKCNAKFIRGKVDPDRAEKHFNIAFKMYNLAQLTEPFLYLDVDTVCLGSLEPLWSLRNHKPWIAINQYATMKTPLKKYPVTFLNGGVQLVGDPNFLDYEKIVAGDGEKIEPPVPGFEQPLLCHYFRKIGYDYTHPDAGIQWNHCAGFTTFKRSGEHWSGESDDGKPIYLSHYWGRFKPWKIGCPIYADKLSQESRALPLATTPPEN